MALRLHSMNRSLISGLQPHLRARILGGQAGRHLETPGVPAPTFLIQRIGIVSWG
jgi:hypothetical protein